MQDATQPFGIFFIAENPDVQAMGILMATAEAGIVSEVGLVEDFGAHGENFIKCKSLPERNFSPSLVLDGRMANRVEMARGMKGRPLQVGLFLVCLIATQAEAKVIRPTVEAKVTRRTFFPRFAKDLNLNLDKNDQMK
ncbi:MAG TPA: hypothetical protein VJR29_08885, partial [bacterium]|nr:hypothetical protein [bacterium]